MATFVFAKGDPKKVKPKAPTKKRGYNPPGARTRNEPERVPFREETEPIYNYRKPKDVPQEDTALLRVRVKYAADRLDWALKQLDEAREAFEGVGPLPTSIIQTLPLRIKRQIHLYKMRGRWTPNPKGDGHD